MGSNNNWVATWSGLENLRSPLDCLLQSQSLCFWYSLLLMYLLQSCRWWLWFVGLRLPFGGLRLSSQHLALGCSGLRCCRHLRVNQRMENLCLSNGIEVNFDIIMKQNISFKMTLLLLTVTIIPTDRMLYKNFIAAFLNYSFLIKQVIMCSLKRNNREEYRPLVIIPFHAPWSLSSQACS